ncbi:MAG: hypothetical protein II951_04365 [Bacteroidales bacterium]|nr:hypothetical protein [Bacteroidales bacterium]
MAKRTSRRGGRRVEEGLMEGLKGWERDEKARKVSEKKEKSAFGIAEKFFCRKFALAKREETRFTAHIASLTESYYSWE